MKQCPGLSEILKNFSVTMMTLTSPVLFFRSAPASPSHIGVSSGTVTPDSLSREGSPIPEGFENNLHMDGNSNPATASVASSANNNVLHGQSGLTLQSLPQVPKFTQQDFVRFSQSAPGSPQGSFLLGMLVACRRVREREMIWSDKGSMHVCLCLCVCENLVEFERKTNVEFKRKTPPSYCASVLCLVPS